jgi:hypothetical protein
MFENVYFVMFFMHSLLKYVHTKLNPLLHMSLSVCATSLDPDQPAHPCMPSDLNLHCSLLV